MIEFWSGALVALLTFTLTSIYERYRYKQQLNEQIRNDIYETIYNRSIEFVKQIESFRSEYEYRVLIDYLLDADFMKSVYYKKPIDGTRFPSQNLLKLNSAASSYKSCLIKEGPVLKDFSSFIRYHSYHFDSNSNLLKELQLLQYELLDQYYFTNDIINRLSIDNEISNDIKELYLDLITPLRDFQRPINETIINKLTIVLNTSQTKKVK